MQNSISNYRKNARFAGLMYLLCMVTSIGGGLIISGIFNKPDAILDEKIALISGTVLELINAFGVMGIAAAFWVPLKEKMPATAAGYMGLRSIEAALCIIAAFIPVLMIQLAEGGSAAYSNINVLMNILIAARGIYWAYIYTILFFISGLLFYTMLYKSMLVPRYISVWGLVALLGVAAALFVPSVKYIPGLLIIANEVYLGIYLIVKGFRTPEAKSI